ITVDDGGENQIVISPGANGALSPGDVDRRGADIAVAAAVIAQLEVPLEAIARAFELGRLAGVLTVLNAAPLTWPDVLEPLLALTDLTVCNLGEARSLVSGDECEPGRLAARMTQRTGGQALVTAGKRGAWLQPGPGLELLHQPAFQPSSVIDSTGAGDAFIGAFLCRWGETRDRREALRFGAAAGALACETLGAVASLASRATIEHRLNGWMQAQ
ncbi:MAG: PfkB family carbohydrate kinase, partial [Pseudomonadota bacterium]